MTFSFKLSPRLAQSWVVVVAAAALAACATQRSITNPTTPPDTTTYQPRPAPIGGYYASPTGSSAGDGSAARPWDLTTALAGGSGRVQPGDTVWVRARTYTWHF